MSLSSFFKDSEDRVIIAQWPNYSLWAAIVFFTLRYVPSLTIQTFASWGLIISLLYWSYLEIAHGVNYWRRFLGLAVGMSQLLNLLLLLS